MRQYIFKRILLGIVTLIGVSIIVFFAARLSGDVALLLAPTDATDEQIESIRVQMGLDKPIPVQYLIFIRDAIKGDFGISTRYNQPVVRMILDRVPATLELAATSFTLVIVLGLVLGVFAAWKRDSWIDWTGKLFAILGQSMPAFWTGVMFILFFGVELNWLPTSGKGGIQYLIMPTFCLAWYSIASVLRITRSSMLDVLDSEYVKMARIKGNRERTVIWIHTLRNAIIPVLGLAGIQLAMLVGGAVIIEVVFRWPGLGSLILEAVYNRDYALVQAGVFFISIFVVIINLVIDLLYSVVDPRIRYE